MNKVAIRLKLQSWENLIESVRCPNSRICPVTNFWVVLQEIERQLDEFKALVKTGETRFVKEHP